MKQEVTKEIEIPSQVNIEINESKVIVKGPRGSIERKLEYPTVTVKKQDNKITIGCKKATKREKKVIGTFIAHIRNMIKGVIDGFEYKLQICSVHFPINVKLDTSKHEIVIKNFLGEVSERRAKVLPGVDVKIVGNIITVSSINKESAGQTALNIENATRIKNRDRRIFQDGIFIIEKCGKKI